MIWTPMASRGIYQELHHRCRPYFLPEPWNGLPADADVRVAPRDLPRMVARLAQKFATKDLVRAGVAQKTAEGALVPTAALSVDGPLIFLRRSPEQTPVEVLTAAGGLSGRHLPVVAALSDHRTARAIEAWDRHLLVASMPEDVAVLRSLGFGATLAAGLENIDARQLNRLCQHFGWRKRIWPKDGSYGDPDAAQDASEETETEGGPGGEIPASPYPGADTKALPEGGQAEPKGAGKKRNEKLHARPASLEFQDPADPLTIILLGWSPSQLLLEKPGILDAIVARLRAIQNHLGVNNMAVGLWVPGKPYMERLLFQLQFDPGSVSPAEMFAEMQESCEDAMFDSPSPPANYLEALGELRDALRASSQQNGGKERLRWAWEQYDSLLERDLLAPLLRPTDSPGKRNLQTALVLVSRQMHLLGSLVNEGLARMLREGLLAKGELIQRGPLNQFVILVRNMIALSKELRS